MAERFLALAWMTGLGDAPASVMPYLVHPWVVAGDRLKSAGWKPRYSNEEALLLAPPVNDMNVVPWMAGAAVCTAGSLVGAWLVARGFRRVVRRVGRSTRPTRA
jgi:hypothetical protein